MSYSNTIAGGQIRGVIWQYDVTENGPDYVKITWKYSLQMQYLPWYGKVEGKLYIDGNYVDSASFLTQNVSSSYPHEDKVVRSGVATVAKTSSSRSVAISLYITMTGDRSAGVTSDDSTSVTDWCGPIGAALPKYTLSYNSAGGRSTPASSTNFQGYSVTVAGAPTAPADTYTYPTITVSFDKNGGDTVPDSVTGSATNRTTYSFVNWYSGSTNYNPGTSITLWGNMTLTARWSSSTTRTANPNITLPLQEPTKRNYKFLGYATTPNGIPSYFPGKSYTFSNSVTLYAVWKILTATLSFYNESGVRKDARLYLYDSSGNRRNVKIYQYNSLGQRGESI